MSVHLVPPPEPPEEEEECPGNALSALPIALLATAIVAAAGAVAFLAIFQLADLTLSLIAIYK
ncbi:MAG: hypothetical protein QM586_11635 [Xenophilus sp.]